MAESTQHKLDRVRSPRVQITYDVEVGDAIQQKQIPFVAGVLADLSGQPAEPLPKLKDRKFVEVDRDNFNGVLAGMKPRLAYRVPNLLSGDDSTVAVEIKFKEMEDFEPQRVVQQIEPLRKLLEARNKLTELLTKMDGNDRAVDSLEAIIRDTEQLKQLAGAAGRRPSDQAK